MHATESHTADALQQLRTERAQVEAECDALDDFLERIIERSEPVETRGGADETFVRSTVDNQRATTGLDRIREAYRETVMAVPHYDEYYGDSLEASLLAEFGPDVAAVVTGTGPLSRVAHAKLVHEAQRVRQHREQFLEVLDGERDDLEDARTTHASIVTELEDLNSRPVAERSSDELQHFYDRLDELREECEALVADRQSTFRLRSRRELPRIETEELATYLYRSLSVDHPVLADFVDLSARVETNGRHVERELMSRQPFGAHDGTYCGP